jgi:hypothetical protein
MGSVAELARGVTETEESAEASSFKSWREEVEEVSNECGTQRRLLLVRPVPSQKVTDDLGNRHPIDPPLRQRWGHLGQHFWLDRVHDEEPVEITISEQAHGEVEVLLEGRPRGRGQRLRHLVG